MSASESPPLAAGPATGSNPRPGKDPGPTKLLVATSTLQHPIHPYIQARANAVLPGCLALVWHIR